jgi:hypothetical protein
VRYQLPAAQVTRQGIETLGRLDSPAANRNVPGIVEYARHGQDLLVVVD